MEQSYWDKTEKKLSGRLQECRAYFTVEAALVLPIVMCVLLFVIFMSVYQYNRCLMEQDVGMMVLYAGTSDEEGDVLENNIKWKLTDLYMDKYILWQQEELDISVKGNSVEIKGTGSLCFPLSGWSIMEVNSKWSAQTKKEMMQLSPVQFIRLCQRIQRGE